MIPIELWVAWGAIVLAGVWIYRLQHRLYCMEEACTSAEEALKAAHEAVDTYQCILTDVALEQTTLEITHDGQIIATRRTDRAVQIH